MRVQFFGYRVVTGLSGFLGGMAYHGLKDSEADLDARIRILVDAIESAERHPAMDPEALKVFAAPEFFFRGGQGGAYDLSLIAGLNEKLDTYLATPRYRNWLFFPGTVAGSLDHPSGKVEVFNLSLIRKGGIPIAKPTPLPLSSLPELDSVVVYKEYLSTLDFMGPFCGKFGFRNATHGGRIHLHGKLREVLPTEGARNSGGIWSFAPANNPGRWIEFRKMGRKNASEWSQTGLGGGGLFRMYGLDFMAEICMDHMWSRGNDGLNQEMFEDTGFGKPDVQIIMGAGTKLKYVHARQGGFVFMVDGGREPGSPKVILNRVEGEKESKVLALPVEINMTESVHWRHFDTDGRPLFLDGRGVVHISTAHELEPKGR